MNRTSKFQRALISAAVLALGVLTVGCTSRVGTFSVISTAPPQYNKMQGATVRKDVEATDGRWWFLFIPLGPRPTIGGAVDRALRQGDGDFIERAEIYRSGWTLIVFSRGSYRVRGDVGDSAGNRGR